jgi:hypothetical protein
MRLNPKTTNMQALRQIVNVNNHSLNILLPNDFMADKVEVIVLSIEEQKPSQLNSVSSLRGKLNLTNEQYNNFQQYINDSRNEWDRNI